MRTIIFVLGFMGLAALIVFVIYKIKQSEKVLKMIQDAANSNPNTFTPVRPINVIIDDASEPSPHTSSSIASRYSNK